MRWTALFSCLVALALVASVQADQSIDTTLRTYFPERDLTRSAIKIADRSNGTYIVCDSFEILKTGEIRATNSMVLQKLNSQPNQSRRFTSYEAPLMILSFEKSIKSSADFEGNRFTKAVSAKPNGK